MIKEAIILAGGLGTRLRSVVSELPKCMAPVNGKPFLHYLIAYLEKQGVEKFIFAIGYKSEAIITYLQERLSANNYILSEENEPLGTGGAIYQACTKATEKDVLVVNGDTLFEVDTHRLLFFHHKSNAECTLALKPMHNFDRYGVVELTEHHSINSFKEKQFYESGLINGGVYLIQTATFLAHTFEQKFSFEKDYLEQYVHTGKLFGLSQDEYFIDIGIPEDYARVQTELKN